MIFKKDERHNIIQNIGNNNTGMFQINNSGRDVYITQHNDRDFSSEEITKTQALGYLTKIEELIKEANLPSAILEEATHYASIAKKETEQKEPRKSLIVDSLEGVTSVLQKLNQTLGIFLVLCCYS